MNINQQEQQALFTSKLIEGKDEITARNEIMRDLKFIKDFNQTKRELERILKALEKDIGKRINKIESLKFEGQKRQIKALKEHSEPHYRESYNASVKHLWRIIRLLESSDKFYNIKEISESIVTSKEVVSESVNFLIKTQLIKHSEHNGVCLYGKR